MGKFQISLFHKTELNWPNKLKFQRKLTEHPALTLTLVRINISYFQLWNYLRIPVECVIC